MQEYFSSATLAESLSAKKQSIVLRADSQTGLRNKTTRHDLIKGNWPK